MKLFTTSLTTAGSFTITSNMDVTQFSVCAGSSDAEFTINGDGKIISQPSIAVGFAEGQGGYNSATAQVVNPWNGVTIACTQGTVNIALTQQ